MKNENLYVLTYENMNTCRFMERTILKETDSNFRVQTFENDSALIGKCYLDQVNIGVHNSDYGDDADMYVMTVAADEKEGFKKCNEIFAAYFETLKGMREHLQDKLFDEIER